MIALAIGTIIVVVVVLLIHIERNHVGAINPIINLTEIIIDNMGESLDRKIYCCIHKLCLVMGVLSNYIIVWLLYEILVLVAHALSGYNKYPW